MQYGAVRRCLPVVLSRCVAIVMCAEFVEKGCGLSANDLIDKACNPRLSCVIEACAGSGKTWLLISRIFRLLLDGVAPNEILAITFTRKAAQEMRERLESVLKEYYADEIRVNFDRISPDYGDVDTLFNEYFRDNI